jgi:para-aminobenzoate synthetase / 4-amino-4-deoxychorismate lyase
MPAAPHPDPERGVFETLLVIDGRPVELDAHLERLSASLEALFESTLPLGARQRAFDCARPIRLGRLRLTVAPGEDESLGVELAAEHLDPALFFPAREWGAELRSLVVEGGLGAHKWADRRLLERAEANGLGDAVPLLLDRDGTVLEASRANVFAARDGVLATPPADGRIIAGIARKRVLGLAREAGFEPREERLTIEDLLGAEEVFLTGSVRGVEPVRSIDGTELGTGGIAAEVAAGLQRSWLGQRQALDLL